MTKADIACTIARTTGLPQLDTAAVIDGVIEVISQALARGEHVEIRGFGTFKVADRAPRIGRNLQSGGQIQITRRRVPVFKPSQKLRDQVQPPPAPGTPNTV